jgi:hypothetical protein
MSKLTTQLDTTVEPTEVVMNNPADFSAIIQKINDSLANMDFEQKSNLIGDNSTGILQAMELNNFIETRLGKEFRIESLDILVYNKMKYVMSVENKGVKNLLDALRMLQPNIISQLPVTLQDRLLGDSSNPNNPNKGR